MVTCRMARCTRLPFLLGAAFSAMLPALPAHAASPADDPWDGDWHGSFTPYGWLPGIRAETTFQLPANGARVTSRSDSGLLSKLSGALMLEGVARKGKWGLFGDVDWVKFSDESGHFTSIGNQRFGADTGLRDRWGVKGGLVNLAGLYNLGHGNRGYADLLVGMRYLWLKGNLSWDFAATGQGGRLDIDDSGRLHGQLHVTDAIVGLRGRWMPFGNSAWFFPYYVDVGTGDSDNTWQFIAGAGYRFHWGDVAVSYRDVRYREDADNRLLRKAELSGPALSVTWHF